MDFRKISIYNFLYSRPGAEFFNYVKKKFGHIKIALTMKPAEIFRKRQNVVFQPEMKSLGTRLSGTRTVTLTA